MRIFGKKLNMDLIKTIISFFDAGSKLRQTLCLLVVAILMSSCATILNQPYKNVKVYTTEPSSIIYRYDTIKTVKNKANLWVERKKDTLSFVTMTDSITKSIEIKSRNSFMYWVNIYNYGIGMLVDMNNPKRYSYPSRIHINSADTISKYYRYSQASFDKGGLYLHLSLPHINSFCFKPEKEGYKSNTGFWGISAGLDYYHSTNQFISLMLSGVMDIWLPVPASIHYYGENEFMNSLEFI